ncbi:uncharacterized protein BX663DRAFT_522647 [Cokeromyces recurvatus]|uniref:uncharacterized protein n=1 Tax=Cokeromyces recurvatus TaxID=90255 RepID=UPI00221FA842|nr:uncharacterized protein BX663DRAFT_522647 [Cokeromyces recurvatus]KAI7898957.1 hypothetical protein BX663DRAFT_522647 [Cokeromyces recurvatus]
MSNILQRFLNRIHLLNFFGIKAFVSKTTGRYIEVNPRPKIMDHFACFPRCILRN